MPFPVACPHCRRPFTATEAQAGTTLACPHCRGLTTAPSAPARAVAPPAAAAPPAADEFEIPDDEPASSKRLSRPRRAVNQPVSFPIVFHVAAWMVILTCIAMWTGLFAISVQIRNTYFRPM